MNQAFNEAIDGHTETGQDKDKNLYADVSFLNSAPSEMFLLNKKQSKTPFVSELNLYSYDNLDGMNNQEEGFISMQRPMKFKKGCKCM